MFQGVVSGWFVDELRAKLKVKFLRSWIIMLFLSEPERERRESQQLWYNGTSSLTTRNKYTERGQVRLLLAKWKNSVRYVQYLKG
jgi:hypothetical protein